MPTPSSVAKKTDPSRVRSAALFSIVPRSLAVRLLEAIERSGAICEAACDFVSAEPGADQKRLSGLLPISSKQWPSRFITTVCAATI